MAKITVLKCCGTSVSVTHVALEFENMASTFSDLYNLEHQPNLCCLCHNLNAFALPN